VRMARYCKPLDPAFLDRLRRRCPTTMEAFNACVFGTYQPQPQRYCPERYHVVNFASACLLRRTVEFRAYPSTVMHAGKIKAAIILSLALTARAITARAVASSKRGGPHLGAL
ncbi:MAG TPA: amidoligase family protein, partial [Armatimonadota bacterium]|nr:amidoligase family protein [Armatimonadota bacterium]